MIYILQNIIPIAVATALGLAIGALWLRATGWRLPGASVLVLSALAQFWLAAILAGALILAPSEAGVWVMTIGSALVIWCGFVLPALAVTLAVGGVRAGRILSACACWLVMMLAMAVVMRAIGLASPAV